jgi:hypothetical protein
MEISSPQQVNFKKGISFVDLSLQKRRIFRKRTTVVILLKIEPLTLENLISTRFRFQKSKS